MVQVIERTDPFGRIGKSIGGGLGEAAEEIGKKYALSKGLENIRSSLSKDNNITPFQMQSKLLSIPGISAEMAQSLSPLLNQEMLRAQSPQTEAQETDKPNFIPETSDLTTPIDGPYKSSSPFFEKYGFDIASLETDQDIETAKSRKPVRNESEIENRAFELFKSNPLLYPNLDSARKRANQEFENSVSEFDEVINQGTRRAQIQNTAIDEFNKKVSNRLQTDRNSYADIPGEYMEKIENSVVKDILENNKKPKVAAAEAAAKALTFAKSRNTLKSSSPLPMVGSEGKWAKNLKTARKSYENIDALELYKDDLKSSQGISDPFASKEAFPLSTSMKKSFVGIKPSKAIISGSPGIPQIGTNLSRPSETVVKKFVESTKKNITESDSIPTIQLKIRSEGYYDSKFMEALQEEYKNGNLKLNDRQVREIENIESISPSTSDIWFWITSKFR